MKCPCIANQFSSPWRSLRCPSVAGARAWEQTHRLQAAEPRERRPRVSREAPVRLELVVPTPRRGAAWVAQAEEDNRRAAQGRPGLPIPAGVRHTEETAEA